MTKSNLWNKTINNFKQRIPELNIENSAKKKKFTETAIRLEDSPSSENVSQDLESATKSPQKPVKTPSKISEGDLLRNKF